MDRQRRSASRVTDYRKYHLSGDLDQVLQGRVSNSIDRLEKFHLGAMDNHDIEDSSPEELQELLKEQKESSSKLQQQVEAMKLRNELEAEKMQQEQWELAIQQLKQSRDIMAQQHERNKDRIRSMASEATKSNPDQAVAWMQTQLNIDRDTRTPAKEQDPQKAIKLEHLRRQQEELNKQIEDITAGEGTAPDIMETLKRSLLGPSKGKTEQELLMEQIRTTLAPKTETERDPNKALLKALITAQNKTSGSGGTSTLKPDIISKLTGEGEFSMAEWLATLNKQEEGESEINKILNRMDDESDCRSECKHSKIRSGMLDKSTTNIRHKEVWPQKNLGEDWAEEEMEFKQLKFEHLVAGETRTIETCTEPAEILGRLQLLRRISYLRLRGIEWHLLRKMYAAILSSIETREYSWESNFDRFESILYRRVLTERGGERDWEHKPQEGRKRFCRDYNRPEGCPKNSPHTVWIGAGPSANKRMVYHYCAACLIRDKTPREHPEGHADCPHRA